MLFQLIRERIKQPVAQDFPGGCSRQFIGHYDLGRPFVSGQLARHEAAQIPGVRYVIRCHLNKRQNLFITVNRPADNC